MENRWQAAKKVVFGSSDFSAGRFAPIRSNHVYAACLLLFAASVPLVFVDKSASDWLHWTLVPWDHFLQIITSLGDGRFLIPLCFGIWLVLRAFRHRAHQVPLVAFVSAAFAGTAVQALKMTFGRPRPYLAGDSRFHGLDFASFYWLKIQADFNSFPSGHTTITFAIAWVFINLRSPFLFRAAIVLFTVLVAFSRVALGKHFLADVFSAAALGIGCAQCVIDLWLRKALPMLSPAKKAPEVEPVFGRPMS